MNFKKKFIHYCYIINAIQTALIISLFVGFIPLTILFPKFIDGLTKFSQDWIFILLYSIMTFCSIFNWIYCIGFWYKNDRYSKSAFLLLFISIFYAPFYYYQVKIKKRPLKNDIKKEPIIGRTIQLQEYDDETEYQQDLEKI